VNPALLSFAMKRESATHQRRLQQNATHFLPLFVAALCIGVIFFVFRLVVSGSPFRQTVVVVGSPTHVISFDAKMRSITAVDVPDDALISAAMGYGQYTLRALVSLDTIDHRKGRLITDSVTNALGIPISGHVFSRDHTDGKIDIQQIRKIFSLPSIIAILADRSSTSIPWQEWVRLVFAVFRLPADALRVVDLTPAITTITSPDGNLMSLLDESRVDYLLDTNFFDAGLRAEGVTVAVYNTTNTPSVGLRASRLLARVGLQLVFVGNSEPEAKRCLITGSSEHLSTKTARFIRQYFHCDETHEGSVGHETGADVVVLLGTEYASIYK